MKLKKYKIQGIELEQKPLTIGQFMAFGKLLEDIEVSQESNFVSVLGRLIAEKPLQLIEIIFKGQDMSKIDWENEPFEETGVKIFEDFLHLNPKLKERFQKLAESLISRFALPTALPENTAMS